MKKLVIRSTIILAIVAIGAVCFTIAPKKDKEGIPVENLGITTGIAKQNAEEDIDTPASEDKTDETVSTEQTINHEANGYVNVPSYTVETEGIPGTSQLTVYYENPDICADINQQQTVVENIDNPDKKPEPMDFSQDYEKTKNEIFNGTAGECEAVSVSPGEENR